MVHGRVQYTLTLSLTRHTAQATALGTPSPNAAGTYGFMVIRLLVLAVARVAYPSAFAWGRGVPHVYK